jgi:hypothetical protein
MTPHFLICERLHKFLFLEIFVAYLLKARTADPEKQPLLSNSRNIHARNNGGTVGNGM